MSVPSSSKIVLITGANQGIGFEIAKALSSKDGFHVLLGSRDGKRGLDAAKQLQGRGAHVESVIIDVTSDDSISESVKHVASKFGRLDVLINNAGICPTEKSVSGLVGLALRTVYQDVFAVNTFGAAATTEAFLPLLSKSTTPRIVFMSSTMGSLGSRWGSPVAYDIYRSSKSALNMIMLNYAMQYKDDPRWKINASCPGFCATNLNQYAGADTPENGALNAIRLATSGEETGTYTNKEGVITW